MFVKQFVDPGLGNSSYLVGSEESGVAVAIDPVRDAEPYIREAGQRGVRITHILETHLHADFVSGSRELGARTGAVVCAGAKAGLQYDHRPVREG
ncbi:MAG: MBL fold metallo-hydrolase, partial [Dehalococcoidia bacterium]|nr:MBL fold metallo-hydrolase [Dehalococcoidia bacterium]